jgi:SAM-dependent methyltransferase
MTALPATLPGPAAAELALEPALCCVCGVEDAEPVAVGEDFEYRTSPDAFLAVRCNRCGVVYLNPRPSAAAMPRIYPNDYHAFAFEPAEYGLVYRVRRRLEARRLRRWGRGLKAGARVLDVGCGDGVHLDRLRALGDPTWQLDGVDADPRAVAAAAKRGLSVRQGTLETLDLPVGAYDLVLLVMTVEHVPDPRALLVRVRELLTPGGRLVVVTDNAASPDGWLFRGRHWGGYHFPRHPYLFDAKNLATLAAAAGLGTVRVRTATSPVNWVYSVRNLLDDWGAPRWLVDRFSLKGAVPLAAFTLLDSLFNLAGRGAILHGQFVKPEVELP